MSDIKQWRGGRPADPDPDRATLFKRLRARAAYVTRDQWRDEFDQLHAEARDAGVKAPYSRALTLLTQRHRAEYWDTYTRLCEEANIEWEV